MNILVLDDDFERHFAFHKRFEEQFPGSHIVHVKNFDECIEAFVTNEKFDLVQLDHDLGDYRYPEDGPKYELTGTEVVMWMRQNLQNEKRPDKVIIHSWNPDGARRMAEILWDSGFDFIRNPFTDAREKQ